MDTQKGGQEGVRWIRLSAATDFALKAHGMQLRKGGNIPYISHLLSVAGLVLEYGGDEDQAIAGLLHDVIEDQGVTATEVATRFGPRVACIVEGCTDSNTLPKPPWRARKNAYIAHLEEVEKDVLLVSWADKLHNVRAICADLRRFSSSSVFGRFKGGGRDGALWYYRALSEVFNRRMPGPLAFELERAVRELHDLANHETG